jgi:hypothetical protein
MAEPAEEQAIVALVAALETGLAAPPLAPGDWDYINTPLVRRAPLPPLGQQMKPDECPVLYVVPGQGSHLVPVAVRGTVLPRGAYTYNFNVDLHGFVHREPSDDVLADTERWRFRSHVADVVHANRYLGGLSREGIRFGDRPEAVDDGTLAPNAWFALPITIPLSLAFSTVPA